MPRFYIGAYKSLRHRYANMDVLVAGGTSTAYFYSVAVVCTIHEFTWLANASTKGIVLLVNPDYTGMHYFETSALLITFVILGKFLEALAKGRTSEALYKVSSAAYLMIYFQRFTS